MLKGPNTREFQECIVGINIFNKSTMGMKDSPYNRKRKNKMGRKKSQGHSSHFCFGTFLLHFPLILLHRTMTPTT